MYPLNTVFKINCVFSVINYKILSLKKATIYIMGEGKVRNELVPKNFNKSSI